MKINHNKIVNRYQAGGFMVYQPLPLNPGKVQAPQGQPEQAEAPEESNVLDKKVIEKLMGNGIVNDVMAFTEEVEQAYQQYSSMSDLEKQSVYGRQLRSVMKGDFSKVNRLLRNKKDFDEAKEIANDQMALSDFAITNRGVIVKDQETGRIGELSHEEYASKRDKYKILTNSELAQEREYNPSLVQDTNSSNILRNSVGTSKVKEEVVEILSSIGSENSSISKGNYIYYGADSPEQIQKAAQQLIGMGQEGIYKLDQTNESTSNLKNLAAAREAMWMNLSTQAKSLLKAKAASQGVEAADLEDAAKEYAISLLNVAAKTTSKESSDVKWDEDMTAVDGPGRAGGDSLTGNLGYWTQIQGDVGDMNQIKVDLGDGNMTDVLGFTPGGFITNGKPIGKASIRSIPELQSIGDMKSISIGGVKVPASRQDAVIYDGGPVSSIVFPSKTDGSGAKIPDFDRSRQYNELMTELEGVPNVAAREELIRNKGFASDGRGNISENEFDRFIVFDGMINEDALNSMDDKRALRQVDDNEKELYKQLYMYNSDLEDADNQVSGTTGFGFFQDFPFFRNDVYRGRVFIPIEGGPIAGMNVDRESLKISKSQQTPDYLGRAKEMVQQNKNRGTAKYSADL